jgi:hypothetical protein
VPTTAEDWARWGIAMRSRREIPCGGVRSGGREGKTTFPAGPTRTSCNKHLLDGLVFLAGLTQSNSPCLDLLGLSWC